MSNTNNNTTTTTTNSASYNYSLQERAALLNAPEIQEGQVILIKKCWPEWTVSVVSLGRQVYRNSSGDGYGLGYHEYKWETEDGKLLVREQWYRIVERDSVLPYFLYQGREGLCAFPRHQQEAMAEEANYRKKVEEGDEERRLECVKDMLLHPRRYAMEDRPEVLQVSGDGLTSVWQDAYYGGGWICNYDGPPLEILVKTDQGDVYITVTFIESWLRGKDTYYFKVRE